ncbi:redoxin domain-containing protein [Pedobacter sp. P26]|uniref:redoxin domain-containing protein n=1 Tax=Pedobacter sp. P26 TaxID=3423956 RepID=UPI003D667CAC
MKKAKLITLVLLSPFMIKAQNASYELNVTIQGLKQRPGTKAFLIFRNGNKTITDSTLVRNGRFTFQGALSEYKSAQLALDHTGAGLEKTQDFLQLYLEKGLITVLAKDSLKFGEVDGPVINKQARLYKTLLRKNSDKLKSISAKWSKIDPKDSSLRKLNDELASAYKNEILVREQLNVQFIKENPDADISAEILSRVAGPIIEVEKIEPLYHLLSARVRKTSAGRTLGADLASTKATYVGSLSPTFSKSDMDGKMIKLADFKGRYVLIDFWASWCKPCRAENPYVIKAYDKFRDKGFQVLGISLDKDKNSWLKAVKDDALPYTQILDEAANGQRIADNYAVKAIPQNFLIDPKGKIIARNLRGTELDKELKRIFGSDL